MKKLFTLFVALAATLTAGAEQLPLTGTATIPMSSTQPLTVTCPATWDGVNLAGALKVKPADYPKAVIEIDEISDEGTENFSLLCKVSGTTYAFESNVEGKPKQVVKGKIEYSLKTAYENWVWGKDLSDATFDELTIKCRKASQSVTIKSFYLIDNEGNLVPTSYKLLATASAPVYSGNVTFTSKWNELGGAAWASGEVGENQFAIYSILLNTPLQTAGLQFKYNLGDTDKYDGGDGSYTELGRTALYYRKDAAFSYFAVQRGNNDIVSELDVKRAEVNVNKMLIEMPSSGMTTFSYDKAVEIPTGVKAYYASAVDGSSVTMTELKPTDNIIKAYFPVVLVGEPGIVTISLASEEGTAWPGGNLLKAHAANKLLSVDADANKYILSDGQFHSLSANAAKIPPYKAYLQTNADAARLSIVFEDDTTTGIMDANRETITDNLYFDLHGRRVAQPTKGLYIVRSAEGRLQGKNGKKVIKK